jgi:lipoyl(octanoyl) transferase
MKPQVRCVQLGHIEYKQAWDEQERLLRNIVDFKLTNKDDSEAPQPLNYVLLCEHPHVYTLGKSGKIDHLLLDEIGLRVHNASYFQSNRGGDITYHGPGQLVMYPIFDLEQFFRDIHRYMRYLEEAVILTLADFGIVAGRMEGLTGVWLDAETTNARKICAMGVKSSRWVTMHGIGFNINTDLNYFGHIVPCGISDKAVTSMKQELGFDVDMQEVSNRLLVHLREVFNFDYTTVGTETE